MSNRYAILDENGTVINIVKADESTATANGWVLAEGEYAAIPAKAAEPEPESEVDILVSTLIAKGVLKQNDADKIKKAKK